MAQVYLSLGSNIDQYHNISSCLKVLEATFGKLTISPIYESEAVGFEGDNFLNLVVGIVTELSVGELLNVLRDIEDQHGRVRKCERFSARTLDIDILTYDDLLGFYDGVELPRDEVLKNAFVLLPLADLAGDSLHPETQKSFRWHWRQFDQSSQKLWVIDLEDYRARLS